MFGGWTMPAYFFRSEPGAAELRRLRRSEGAVHRGARPARRGDNR
jgi:hypothetical protein